MTYTSGLRGEVSLFGLSPLRKELTYHGLIQIRKGWGNYTYKRVNEPRIRKELTRLKESLLFLDTYLQRNHVGMHLLKSLKDKDGTTTTVRSVRDRLQKNSNLTVMLQNVPASLL